ncbi:MAG TPA: hypothetical protein VIO64_15420 [Pseudobacteroides sp.]|uniref:hypothetical protein n=1 Tax=Pseudobacteroides sp. TaxID=1968840 RepID=UPI002F9393C0
MTLVITLITIFLTFLFFLYFSFKYGVMGVKIKVEKQFLFSVLSNIFSGTAIFNHTLKNQIIKISISTDNIINRCEGIYAAMDVAEIKNTKVIMLTSLKDDDIILDSFTAGAVDNINKENYREIPLAIKRAFAVQHNGAAAKALYKILF